MHDDAPLAAPLDAEALQALLGPSARFCRRALGGPDGVALAPFNDHHVHLQLLDEHALPRHGVAAVVDLGGDPAVFARRAEGIPRVAYAGAFLTVPGGYPSFRPWAPAQVVRIVSSASTAPGVRGGARTAVDEMADAGASVVKIALDATAGPVFAPDVLRAVVDTAHDRGLQAVAHVAGEGMTRLALDAGVDVLAHTPYTDRLEPELVARAAAAGQRWISTLAEHADPEVAHHNAAAFVAAGGCLLYGTDLGNDGRPAALDGRELQALHDAGLRGPALLAALTDPWPHAHADTGVATFIASEPPASVAEVPPWLCGAQVVPAEELVDREP